MPSLTLISFDACPFVQRAAITLEEQNRPYDIQYIDLRNKPDWFLAISPLGKVPVLKVGDTPIFESAVILDYLDETTEGTRLLSEDPLERATQRMWITFISGIMGKAWRFQAAQDEETARGLADELHADFTELSKQLPETGSMWGGDAYTLVDAASAPILQRLTWAETLEPSVRIFDGLPRVAAWRDALLERPSTTSSIVPDLEKRSGRMLKSIGSWIARGYSDNA